MHTRAATIAISALLGTSAGVEARETLEVFITTPEGQRFQAHQELGATFEVYDSGAISGPSTVQEYSAIRCDSAWGAMKYRIPLASGPGYRLEAHGDKLRLRVVEYSVHSEDTNIAAMEVHCIDSAPRPITNALGEVTLERGSEQRQSFQLAGGYLVEFRYRPSGSGGTLASEGEKVGASGAASQQADAGLTTSDEG
ncbi:hypothetical protein [Microbulbifer guangxiensis]|uniref:hypothetical protein n=1 Tax=Microbulbifer guangxiensis TaxID=2904249 RepID=UPI001F173843|nr:hypothetical protein [Microbulbifer guangxiensis]